MAKNRVEINLIKEGVKSIKQRLVRVGKKPERADDKKRYQDLVKRLGMLEKKLTPA